MNAAAIVIEVKVRPQAGRSRLEQAADGSWRAELKAAPVDGQANAELLALVARHFGCARAAVSIRAGASGRRKRVRIDAPEPAARERT